jgi:hypothetical protein
MQIVTVLNKAAINQSEHKQIKIEKGINSNKQYQANNTVANSPKEKRKGSER